MRERLARERARREAAADLPARVATFAGRLSAAYETRPVGHEECDAAAGDEG